ncbi:MAG: hypothetical protein U0Q15_04630 [Kineosporiaceae bacterium]
MTAQQPLEGRTRREAGVRKGLGVRRQPGYSSPSARISRTDHVVRSSGLGQSEDVLSRQLGWAPVMVARHSSAESPATATASGSGVTAASATCAATSSAASGLRPRPVSLR